MIRTRILPAVLAAVLALNANAAVSMTAYAVETTPAGTEEESTSQDAEEPSDDLIIADPDADKTIEEPASEKTPEEADDTEMPEEADDTETPEEADDVEAPEEAGDVEAPEEAGDVETPEEDDEAETPEEADEAEAPEEADDVEAPEETDDVEAPEEMPAEADDDAPALSEEAEASADHNASGSASGDASARTLEGAEGPKADEHHLAFASDYHNTEGSIRNAFEGMPEDVEYVGMIGDMVGDRGNMRPEYDSGMILDQVREVFPDLDNTNVSIIWATHDLNVNDEGTDIVKCMGGTGSGQIYEGMKEDSSPAYYIYAIAHYEMTEGDGTSSEAAGRFKTWVDSINHTIPVIVVCHVPIQAWRRDNKGASYWNEALNYAATGTQGITTTDQTADIIRNVLFLHGHNHTVDRDEHYFGAGTQMNVQIDIPAEQGPGGRPPFDPGRKAEGILSNIYYTSLTAGYLKTSGNATLVTIKDGALILTKYNGGQNVDLGTMGETKDPAGKSIIIPAQRHIRGDEVEENITLATCEHSGDYDVAVYCTVCGEEMYRTHFTTKAVGHSWGKWTVVREATEEAEGEESRTCSVCGKKEYRAIAQLEPENPDKPETPEKSAESGKAEDPEEDYRKEPEQKEAEDPADPGKSMEPKTDPSKESERKDPGAAHLETVDPTPKTASAAANIKTSGSPKTSDGSSAVLWLILMNLSMAALWGMYRMGEHKHAKD